MEYIRQGMAFEAEGPTALSLGKFDGLHRGHGLLMRRMEEKKREEKGLRSAVFTFDAPIRRQEGGRRAQVLTTNREKRRLFAARGVDYLVECPFTEEVMRMEPEDFIQAIAERLHPRHIVVGEDFRFGHGRRGDPKMLRQYAGRHGYEVTVVEKLWDGGQEISSTRIRDEIAAGNLERANELLGYAFFAEGEVLHGEHMGKAEFGIPTINLRPPEEKLLPQFGVYVTVTECGGARYPGITDVGCKPTIEGKRPAGIETHLFDVSKDLYGQEVRVSFLAQVRREKKFHSLEELKAQMERDIRYGREYMSRRAASAGAQGTE